MKKSLLSFLLCSALFNQTILSSEQTQPAITYAARIEKLEEELKIKNNGAEWYIISAALCGTSSIGWIVNQDIGKSIFWTNLTVLSFYFLNKRNNECRKLENEINALKKILYSKKS